MEERNTLADVVEDIEMEGFDYAMSGHYRSYDEVEDATFREYLTGYQAARKLLVEYLGVDE